MARGIRLKSATDVRRFLAKVLNELHSDKINDNRARAMGYVANILLSVIRDSDFETRIENLEKQQKENK